MGIKRQHLTEIFNTLNHNILKSIFKGYMYTICLKCYYDFAGLVLQCELFANLQRKLDTKWNFLCALRDLKMFFEDANNTVVTATIHWTNLFWSLYEIGHTFTFVVLRRKEKYYIITATN